jgi:type VI protein secretion system component Hcp
MSSKTSITILSPEYDHIADYDVVSFSWGIDQPDRNGSQTARQDESKAAQCSDFIITCQQDKNSVLFHRMVLTGKQFDMKVAFSEQLDTEYLPYLVFHAKNAKATNFGITNSGDFPTCSVSFSFSDFEYQ